MKLNVYDLKCLIEDNYLKTKQQKKWFEDILPKSTIRVYNSATENEKKSYDNYCKHYNLDINEFRGMSWDDGTIMLNNTYETEESLCWIMLHELGHITAQQIASKFDYDTLEILSGGALSEMSKEQYTEYCSNDEIHESRFEEIFANQFANVIIGKCYDRYWWRKNKED